MHGGGAGGEWKFIAGKPREDGDPNPLARVPIAAALTSLRAPPRATASKPLVSQSSVGSSTQSFASAITAAASRFQLALAAPGAGSKTAFALSTVPVCNMIDAHSTYKACAGSCRGLRAVDIQCGHGWCVLLEPRELHERLELHRGLRLRCSMLC
jgi:hypothetical protein